MLLVSLDHWRCGATDRKKGALTPILFYGRNSASTNEQLDSPPPHSWAIIAHCSKITRPHRRPMKIQLFLLAAFVAAIPYATADEPLRIAVASNFASQLKIAVSAYRIQDSDSGEISISVGSTGKLFAQIKQGAPFDLFFAADQPRPAQLYEEGFTAGPSQTYTVGRLVLWHPKQAASTVLTKQLDETERLAMANPALAPYGLAAQQTLMYLNWKPESKTVIATAENVGQTYAMIVTGNADAGFVALSQVLEQQVPEGTFTTIPADAHDPIKQDVVLLNTGSQAARAADFLNFFMSHHAQRQKPVLGAGSIDR
ncbi:MAG: molybdate ABC transporter substrate-binding protein [Gammaproteobacteria bacterium]|nr:molybdate ABC transporter substrate-binding protein [Gammaproteobacteria bacterium]